MGRFAGFVLVLVFLTALAGCTRPDAEAHDHDEHDHEAMMSTENETSNQTVIVPTINVFVEGNLTEPTSGSIPAHVGANITFDGSNTTGENLTFAWDFGDNVTGDNASETHAYSSAGLFNVTLAVTRGNTTVNASVLLNVTAAIPEGVVWMDVKSFSGTLPVGNPNAAFQANVDYRDHTVTIVDADLNGTAVMAKRVRWTLDGSGPGALDMTLYWRQGSNLATAGTTATADETLIYEADMPPGDYVIRVRFNAGVNASYTVSGEIDYEAS